MAAYYNECDKNAANWIRELIKAGHVAPGEVDERSIEDIYPKDLDGFTQHHFFAGIAVWSYALRRAGWPDDRPIWTGSCPCQPYSAAGKGEGFADERHLWPSWFHLIDIFRPVAIVGEQVSSKDALAWIDLVSDDLEGAGYSIRTLDIPACSVGAPHRRNRFYFVADASSGITGNGRIQRGGEHGLFPQGCVSNDLALPAALGWRGRGDGDTTGNGGKVQVEGRGSASDVADAETSERRRSNGSDDARRRTPEAGGSSPTSGFWRDAEWLYCTDEKYRAVEPGTFPLASGIAGRVGLLRGYGNAIVAPLAEEFIRSYIEL